MMRSRRRFGSRSFRSFRPSFRRAPTHQPKRTGLYNRANIAFTPIAEIDGPLQSINTVLVLAQIFNRWSEEGAGIRGIANAPRFLDIGGVVLNYQVRRQPVYSATAFATEQYLAWQLLLCSDRIDSDGAPAAIDTNWFTNTPPVNITTATEQQDEEQRFPTRIHYRTGGLFDQSLFASPQLAAEPTQYTTAVGLAQGRINKKLRLRLDDEHCFTLHFHLGTNNQWSAENGSAIVTAVVTGTMYYRFIL